MNWNHLYYFYEVARHGGVKKASQTLGCAPSTVSEQIKKLEESLGVQLFKKKGREIILTDRGREVFDESREIFDKGKRLIDSIKPNDLAGYNVKISIENQIFSHHVHCFLSKFWDYYSNFGLVETKRSKNLSQSLFFLDHDFSDIALTTSGINDQRFFAYKIMSLDILAHFGTGEITDATSVHEILNNTPVAFYGTSDKEETKIRAGLYDQGIYIKEEITSEHPDFLIELCKLGKIVLFMPKSSGPLSQGLATLSHETGVRLDVYAMGKKSQEQLLFIKKLKQLVSDLSHEGEGRDPNDKSSPVQQRIISQYLNFSTLGPQSLI